MKTIIQSGLIITFIHEGYHAIKMKYGDILIEAGRIAEVSECIEPAEHPQAAILDAQGKLVLPGFVNVGSQSVTSVLLNGLLPDVPRLGWQGTLTHSRLHPMLNIADEMLSPEEKYTLALWAIDQAVSGGCTTLVDCGLPGFAEATLMAASELGVRYWCVAMKTAGGFPTALQDGSLICEEPRGGHIDPVPRREGRITKLESPYSVETTSREMWKQAAGERMFLYGAYSRYEQQISRMRFGCSPIAALADCGALSEKTAVLQCLYTDRADRERMRQAQAHAACSAVWAMQEGLPFPAVTLLRQNINTALNTGCYGNCMLDEMRAACFGAKLETGAANAYQASDAFYAATIAGAKILDEPLGRIEPGYHADLLILNPDRLRPLNYPLIQLVYGAQPQDIDMVLVGGEVIRSAAYTQKYAERSTLARRVQSCCEKVWREARKTIL